MISAVKARDRRDAAHLSSRPQMATKPIGNGWREAWANLMNWLSGSKRR